MDHAVLQSLDPVSGMTCHRPCVRYPAQSVSKHTEDNTVSFSLRDMIWRYRDCLGRYLLTYLLTA